MTGANGIDFNFGWYFNPSFGFFVGGNFKIDCPHKDEIKEVEHPVEKPIANEVAEVQEPTASTKAEPIKPLTASERKSLEEVLSAQHRKEIKVTEKTKVSEETLYAATVYRKLSKEDRSDFLKALRERNGVLIGKGENSLTKATNEALNRLIREKKISLQESREIKRHALGKAQLDSDKANIAKSNKKLETVLETYRQNKIATKKEFNKFEKIISSSQSSTTLNSKTVGVNGGFLWKPISDSDGKLAVLLPASFTGAVSKVAIESPAGIIIAQGRDGGVGNGGREHYRFNQSGGSYPDGSSVVVYMKDGTQKSVKIGETSSRVEK